VPFCGNERESSVRERVAENRWSWLASRSWDCVYGGSDWDLKRNWDATEVAEEVL
jgi:hypothetical protein